MDSERFSDAYECRVRGSISKGLSIHSTEGTESLIPVDLLSWQEQPRRRVEPALWTRGRPWSLQRVGASQMAREIQGWRDTLEGGQQGYRERGLEPGPASLPLMQGHSLLCHCLMTLASSPCLLWVGNCYRNSPSPEAAACKSEQSAPSGSEIIQPQCLNYL